MKMLPLEAPEPSVDVRPAPPFESVLDQAQELFRARRLDESLAMLERIEAGSPAFAQAQYVRATVLVAQSRLEDALDAVSKAAETREDAVFLAFRGWLLVRLGRGAHAEQPLTRAADLGSTDIWTYLNLGYLLHTQKRSAEAVAVMRRGLAIKPDEPVLAEHLGRFLMATGQASEAAEVLGRAAQAPTASATVHAYRSWALRACGDLSRAADSLRMAIELDDSRLEWKRQLSALEAQLEAGAAARPRLQNQGKDRVFEAVRLVIWDLDDTFWRGTVTEGGIQEYVQAHHDMVIELARRGIMSSICSKNDEATIARILEERGIAEYFIFPNISWEPKGPRIAALIEAMQLRPATVMFIDDNHLNRAEAARVVPDLQVEDELFLERLLQDPRFKGKDDSKLSRLAQYKLLERRKQDEVKASAGGSNEAFLRGCDIRVHIDYDVLQNLDRAIELVNRTNQLNFTKRRLPEDPEQARAALREELRPFSRQAGLVRVTDRYGDYGFVGFFLVQTGAASGADGSRESSFVHFCFSCRTLGMLVEQWVYDQLGRPGLRVVGEVLTDLSVKRGIDWIHLGAGSVEGAVVRDRLAPEIRFLGGCEASALAFYFNTRCDKVVVRGNFAANSLFFRLNGLDLVHSYTERLGPGFEDEAALLGMPQNLGAFDLFGNAPEGTVLVVNCSRDMSIGISQFRHKEHQWVVTVTAAARPNLNLVSTDWAEVQAQLDDAFRADPEARKGVEAVAVHLRDAYAFEQKPFSINAVEAGIRRLIDRVQPGCRIVFVVDHHVVRDLAGRLRTLPGLPQARERVRAIAAEFPFVGVVSFTDAIASDDEIQQGGNHYDRPVYVRAAEALSTCIAGLRPRSPASEAA